MARAYMLSCNPNSMHHEYAANNYADILSNSDCFSYINMRLTILLQEHSDYTFIKLDVYSSC